MLEKVESSSRPHHTTQFSQSATGIRDGAQRERGESAVTALVVEGEGLTVETDVPDGNGGPGHPPVGQATVAGSTARIRSTVGG